MKRPRQELCINMVIHLGILKNNEITLLPCFIFIPKTGVGFYGDFFLFSPVRSFADHTWNTTQKSTLIHSPSPKLDMLTVLSEISLIDLERPISSECLVRRKSVSDVKGRYKNRHLSLSGASLSGALPSPSLSLRRSPMGPLSVQQSRGKCY